MPVGSMWRTSANAPAGQTPILARVCASDGVVDTCRPSSAPTNPPPNGSGGQPSAGGLLVPPMGEFNGRRNLPTRHRRKGDQWVAGPATARAGYQATVVRAPGPPSPGPQSPRTHGARLPGGRRRLEQWGSGRRSVRRQRVGALAAQPMTPMARLVPRHWPRPRPNAPTTRIINAPELPVPAPSTTRNDCDDLETPRWHCGWPRGPAHRRSRFATHGRPPDASLIVRSDGRGAQGPAAHGAWRTRPRRSIECYRRRVIGHIRAVLRFTSGRSSRTLAIVGD